MSINLNKYTNMYNKRPIIGIISPPFITNKNDMYLYLKQEYLTLFIKNKINFKILSYNERKSYIQRELNNVNGIFLSGSEVGNFNKEKEYIHYNNKVKFIVDTAIKLNKTGKILPVLACCNGFQSIILNTEYKTPNDNYFIKLDAVNYNTHLDFIDNDTNNISKYNKYIDNLALHNCSFGITPLMFNKSKFLKYQYDIIATANDKKNKRFVTFIKHKLYPIYAFQFHPERSITGLLDEYIEDIFKNYYIKNSKQTNKQTNKQIKKIKYKTYNCNNLRKVFKIKRYKTCKNSNNKNEKCHVIKVN